MAWNLKNRARYYADLEDLQNKAIKANILENSMQPIYNVIAMLGVITVIYLGGKKVINDEWTIGIFSTYLTMFTAMAYKASKAAKLFNSVQNPKYHGNVLNLILLNTKVKIQL